MAATLVEVARRAQVSKSTVSLVINGSSLVHPGTAARVMEAIAELNYVPNRSARVLQSGRSHLIGIIVSDITNPYFAELVRSVFTTAKAEAYDGFVFDTDYDTERLLQHLDHLRPHRPDGILLLTTEQSETALARLEEIDLPAVVLNWGVTGRRVSEIAVDYALGMTQLIDHLGALGHRRLAFVGGLREYHSTYAREQAFQHVIAAQGARFEAPILWRGDFRPQIETGVRIVEQCKALPPAQRPTALVASSDLMALSILRALATAGVRVPADISVAGIDDIALASFVTPALTTLDLPRRMMGAWAFTLLKQMIDDPKLTPAAYVAEPRLIMRESVAAAPH